MMKSSRLRLASSSWQNASTLGVCRRSRPKISRRCAHSPKSFSLAYRAAASRGKRVVTMQPGAAPQQLQAGLMADFDASAGHERHPAPEIGQLAALREIQLRARRAQLVIEMMNGRVFLLADIAGLRLPRPSASRLPIPLVFV